MQNREQKSETIFSDGAKSQQDRASNFDFRDSCYPCRKMTSLFSVWSDTPQSQVTELTDVEILGRKKKKVFHEKLNRALIPDHQLIVMKNRNWSEKIVEQEDLL